MLSQEERGVKHGLDLASAVHTNGYISSEDVYLFVLLCNFIYILIYLFNQEKS